MRALSKVVLLSVTLLLPFVSRADVNANTSEEKKQVDVPVMQAGGYSNISHSKLNQLINEGVVVIDIRNKEEWEQTGIIEGSETITFFDRRANVKSDFVERFTQVSKPDQPVILICAVGGRTRAASEAIVKYLGYTKVYNATTGIMGWIAEKRPVVKYESDQ